MAWTYDATNLDTSTASGRLNVVRFLTGDTEATKPQVQDEEINFALSEESNDVYAAGAYIAKTLAAKYSRLVTTELDGDLLVEYSDLMKNYQTLSTELSSKAKVLGAKLGLAAGGLTVNNAFRRYQFCNPPSEDNT